MATVDAQLYVKAETSPGTVIAVAAGDVIDFKSATFDDGGAGPVIRDAVRGFTDKIAPAVTNARWWTGTIVTEMKAGTTVDTPPENAALLQACGLKETVSGGVSVTYELETDPNAAATDYSVTIQKEEMLDGNTWKSFGARMNFQLEWDTAGQLIGTFPYVGAYVKPAAVTTLTAATYNAGIPLVVMSDTTPITFHGETTDVIMRSGKVDLGLTPLQRAHTGGTAANGYSKWPAFLSRAAHSSWEIVIEAVDETTIALFTKWEAATAAAFTMNFDAAGGRSLQVTMPATTIMKITPNDGDSPKTFTVSGVASRSTTNGALKLVYT